MKDCNILKTFLNRFVLENSVIQHKNNNISQLLVFYISDLQRMPVR